MKNFDFFFKNGFIVKKNFFNYEKIKKIKKEIYKIFNKKSKEYNVINLFKKDFDKYLLAAKASNNLCCLQDLFICKKTIDFIKELNIQTPAICTRPIIHFSSKLVSKKETHWRVPSHQDWPSNQGSINGITLWVPFQKTDEKIGCLEIVPGSHFECALEHFYEDVPILKNYKKRFIKLDMNVGDALFFNTFTVHKSGLNKTSKIRLSAATRYNDLSEQTFRQRGYPPPPTGENRKIENLLFPSKEQLIKALKNENT
jgi:ectoine hydroxylase-related dioxygenase (phytanoyl-CoA dioxygenase family)